MAAQTSQIHVPRLPPEIWIRIVESLPLDSARTCLSVSKLFHDAARPTVFARIALSFGAYEAHQYPAQIMLRISDRLDALGASRFRRTQEILECIASDQAFAHAIKTLQIQACHGDYVEDEDDIPAEANLSIQVGRLITAISFLKNLHVFSWYFATPPVTAGIVEALAESCPLLERFEAPIFQMDVLPVYLLTGVKSIRSTWSNDDLEHLALHRRDLAPVFEALLQNMQRPLSGANGIDSCLLNNITNLDLLFEDEYAPNDLRNILRKAPHLQSLTMVPVYDLDHGPQDEMYGALQALPSHLPHFHSLAIGPVDQRMTQSQLNALCCFLRSRPQLRRFATSCALTAADAGPLFEALATLDKLEVVGLYLECEDSPTKKWIHRLLDHIPTGLTALSLSLDHGFANKETFAELWARLPALEFVHVKVHGAAVLTPNQFIQGAGDNLQIVCFQDRFYDVEKRGGELRVVMPPWPWRKVRFRTVEDFGCADWEWLMGNYTFFDYMPAVY